jgi:hypothetical protein
MRTDVFQAVALCCHANAFLARGGERCPELHQNSTFAFTHEIVFERNAGGKLGSGIVADAAGPWLRRLAKEGVERIGVSLQSCPFDPLVAPSEPWGILSDGDVGVEIWTPSWKKRIRSHGDTSPWKVVYTASRAGRWARGSPYALADMKRLLDAALIQCGPAHPLIEKLADGEEGPFNDLFPDDWPADHVKVGTLAARIAAVLRSDEWCMLAIKREIDAAYHTTVSQKLWRASLMALECAARREPVSSAHPTNQNLPLAG